MKFLEHFSSVQYLPFQTGDKYFVDGHHSTDLPFLVALTVDMCISALFLLLHSGRPILTSLGVGFYTVEWKRHLVNKLFCLQDTWNQEQVLVPKSLA